MKTEDKAKKNCNSDQDAEILVDIPCINCSYSLKRQQINGSCPECGQSISQSIEEYNRGRPPAFFRKLACLFLLSVSASIVAVFQIYLPNKMLATGSGRPVDEIQKVQEVATSIGVVSLIAMFVIGIIWICISKYAKRSGLVWGTTLIALLGAWSAPAVAT